MSYRCQIFKTDLGLIESCLYKAQDGLIDGVLSRAISQGISHTNILKRAISQGIRRTNILKRVNSQGIRRTNLFETAPLTKTFVRLIP